MLLLSRFLPRVFQKSEKKRKTIVDDRETLPDKGKLCQCKVLLLDDTEITVNVKATGKGQHLLNKVYDHLNLIERDYFGLRYLDQTDQTHWLDATKAVNSQLKGTAPYTLYFGVKFYAADPCKLREELTRYQFFLQVKRDILQGRLPVGFDLAGELAGLAVQSELGDYDPKRHAPHYVSEFRFVPHQTEDLEQLIAYRHRSMLGQVPEVAEYNYLNRVKWLEMYGVDLHPVQGEGSLEYFLGLTPTGIVVYRNKSKVGNYFWPRITKITFKGRLFIIRVRDKNNDENLYQFECATKQACKHLWKCCVEHHAFFRLTSANESYGATGKLLGIGSKRRFSGRTERQMIADMSSRMQPRVVRTPSKRYERRASVVSNPEGMSPLVTSHSETVISQMASREDRRRQEEYTVPDSPRSTKSAPWETGSHRRGGMFTSGRESPLSTRSEKMMFPRRAPSESESEAPRRRHRRSRMDSDSESEAGVRRRRRRSRVPADESGTESEADARRHRRYRKSAENLHEQKWMDMQTRLRDGSVASMAQSEPGQTLKERKRRRRSRSPGSRRPPEELAQHFKYIDPEAEGIPQEQLQDLQYTAVQTNIDPIKVKYSPRMRHRYSKRRSCGELNERGRLPEGEAPPPYASPAGKAATRRSCPTLHPPATHRAPFTEQLRSPVAVQRNETHTAPIVKTKSGHHRDNQGKYQAGYHACHLPVAVFTPSYINNNYSAYSSNKPNSSFANTSSLTGHGAVPSSPPQTQLVVRTQSSQKHIRDDSGLGIEQDNYSVATSRVIPPYMMMDGQPVPQYTNLPPHKHVYLEQASSDYFPSQAATAPHFSMPHHPSAFSPPAAPPRTASLGVMTPPSSGLYLQSPPYYHPTGKAPQQQIATHSEKMTEL